MSAETEAETESSQNEQIEEEEKINDENEQPEPLNSQIDTPMAASFQSSVDMQDTSLEMVKSHAPQLPLARVKNIMKYDPDVSLTGGETVYLIAKCTELFITRLADTSYRYTLQGKRKTIQRRDVDQTVTSNDHFSFLEGILDRPVL